jgi:putative oxidoreductase
LSTLITWLEAGRRLAERVPYSIVALVARLAVANVFWRSAQTKVDGLHI